MCFFISLPLSTQTPYFRKSPLKATGLSVDEEGSDVGSAIEVNAEDVENNDLGFLDTLLSKEEQEIERNEYAIAEEAARKRAVDKAEKAAKVAKQKQILKEEGRKNNGFGSGFKKGFLSKSKVDSSNSAKTNVKGSTAAPTNTNGDNNRDDKNSNSNINKDGSSSGSSGDSVKKPVEDQGMFSDISRMSIDEVKRELEALENVPIEPPYKAQVVERDTIDMKNAEVIEWDTIKKANGNENTTQNVPESKPRSIFAQQMMNRKTASSTFAKPK